MKLFNVKWSGPMASTHSENYVTRSCFCLHETQPEKLVESWDPAGRRYRVRASWDPAGRGTGVASAKRFIEARVN